MAQAVSCFKVVGSMMLLSIELWESFKRGPGLG